MKKNLTLILLLVLQFLALNASAGSKRSKKMEPQISEQWRLASIQEQRDIYVGIYEYFSSQNQIGDCSVNDIAGRVSLSLAYGINSNFSKILCSLDFFGYFLC